MNRLGDAALSGAIKQALSDMQRDGEQCNPPDWVKEVTAGGDARFYSGEGYLRVYPGFPTLFWGLSVFFVGDLMGKALWKLVENAARFPRRGGRVLCVHGAVSFHRARPCGPRWLPGRGAMRHVELDRRVLGLQSTDE